MTTAKHTPGPWEPIKLNSAPLASWAVAAPGYGGRSPLVCGLEHSKGGPILHAESEANARLIAAAPELLARLQFAAKLLRPTCGHTYQFEQIEAAIAKATGETP